MSPFLPFVRDGHNPPQDTLGGVTLKPLPEAHHGRIV